MNPRKPVAVLCGALLLGLVLAAAPAVAQLESLEIGQQKLADPEDAATAPLDRLMPVDPSILVGELDNGLRYFIRQNGYPANRAEIRLVVKAGSVLEDDDQQGLAHVVEHMAFNGTEHFEKQRLVSTLESFGMRFGAHINASTSFDETIYKLTIPTDRQEILDNAFLILQDWAGGVTFDPEEIEKERGVVIEEWRLGLGAGARVRDIQFPVLFQGSRYAERLPIGTLESLEDFGREELVRFYGDWYRPDLMAVIAVGDFDKQAIEGRIRATFGQLEMPEDPRERPVYDIPEHEATRFAIATDPEVPRAVLEVYHKLPLREQGTHATYRRTIVENMYHSMFNRRLREVATQPHPAFLAAQSSQGIFVPTREVYILGAAVRESDVDRGLEALFGEAERVERFGFTETEMEREKSQLLRTFESIYLERDRQESELFAEEFQRAFLEGESVPGIEYEWALYQRFVPEIELEEIDRVGQRFLQEDNRVVLVTAPDSAADELPSEDRLLAVLESASEVRVTPYVDTVTDSPILEDTPDPGEIVAERHIEEIDVTEWELSNGAKVVIKPTDFREDQVLFRATSPGGTSLASDDEYVPAITAVQAVSASGWGEFSPRALTNLLADKVVQVDPRIGVFDEGFTGGGSPRDVETLFKLVHLKFTEPRAEPATFRLMTGQMRENLQNRDVSPEAAWQQELRRTLTQDHPRRRPFTAEMVDEMDLWDSYAFYQERFADASDFTFVFVGNVEPDTLRPLAERYLATLPATDREETWRNEGVEYPEGVVERVVRRGLEPKSLTSIVFTGPLPESARSEGEPGESAGVAEGSSGDEPAGGNTGEEGAGDAGGQPGPDDNDTLANPDVMDALAQVLQVRLREVLREDLGGTYSVQISGSTSRIPDPEYSVQITFSSDPERLDELTEVVFHEIELLKEAGVEPQEVANVKAALRRDLELARDENGFWLSQLVSAYRTGRDPREVLDRGDSIEALTPELVHEAARAYFDTDRYVQVSLLPEEGTTRD